MSKKSKTLVEHILNIIFLISLLVLSLWLGYRVYQSTKTQDATGSMPHIAEIKQSQQSQYPDYENFNAMKILKIAEHYKIKGNVATGKSLTKKFKLNEKNSIESAYIYIEASVNGNPLGFYDDIYLKINNKGGHLMLDNNLLLVPQKENVSTYLLPLASISYKPSRDAKKETFEVNHDFLEDTNETQSLDILAHINSKKKNKVLIKVQIGYACLDAKDCKLQN